MCWRFSKLIHFCVISKNLRFCFTGAVIFLGLPAILCMQASTGGNNKKDVWKNSTANCPPWMKKMIAYVVLYGMINFVCCMFFSEFDQDDVSAVLRFFSGHWLIFYSIEVGLLNSFLHSSNVNELDASFSLKRLTKIFLVGGVIVLLFVLFAISCFITGHGLLFGFVFVSVWFLLLLEGLNAAVGAITISYYLRKHYPDLWRKSHTGLLKERDEILKQIKNLDDPILKKMKKVFHGIA